MLPGPIALLLWLLAGMLGDGAASGAARGPAAPAAQVAAVDGPTDPGAMAAPTGPTAGPADGAATAYAVAFGPLPFFYDLYTFRGPAGRTTVVASFAVPAGRLDSEKADGGVRYRFDVSLVLADTAQGSVARRDDSVFVRLRRPLPDEHLLSTYIEMHAPPSRNMFQRVIMSDATTPGVGQLYGSYFPIPDYSGSQLMLSDVALGQPDPAVGWERRGATLALLPTTQFPGSAFDVYYEVYNLPYGTPYSTEITVEQAEATETARVDARRPVRIRFAGESDAHADGTLTELRRVETALPNGRYRITVTIRNETSGQTVTRSRFFAVNRYRHRTTLMPAWPHARRETPVGR